MSYAILIDAGYFDKKANLILKNYDKKIIENLIKHIETNVFPDDKLYRVFYYDAAPSQSVITNPIDGTVTDFSKTPMFTKNTDLLEEVKSIPMLALRLGKISTPKNSWEIKNIKSINATTPIKAQQIKPKINQKGVDMKIGLDIASISLKKHASKIILLAGDTDFVPIIKFARSEGVQIFMSTLTSYCPPSLIEHSDKIVNIDLKSI